MSGLTGSNGFSVARTTSYNEVLVNELNVGGNATISGNLTVNGNISPGSYTERTLNIPVATATLSATNGFTTLTAADSGTTYTLNQNASGLQQVIVLPVATVGLTYNFCRGRCY